MKVNCPVCQAEYDLEQGTYQCQCGAKFSVEGHDAVAEAGVPADDDLNKTIAPRHHVDYDPADDRTMPGKRDRKPDGRFELGDLIMGRYKVLAELGQGGMGVVYKCFDETAGIEIALKALPPELSHSAEEMEDIRDNFQLVAKLVHQNIAISKNLERDNSNGNYYLIMECVEGEDLRRWIRRKRKEGGLTLEDVLPVVRQVADALDYAHEQKIIHRDIKPGNIMIDSAGHVKVLDFGLAAQIHTSMTRVSMAYHGTSGTGPYMAPEQWRGRAQGAAADQYALAVMTYEMLAGHLPFESTDATVLREAVLNETPEPIESLLQSAQAALDRALSKESSKRFNSCSVFVAALAGEFSQVDDGSSPSTKLSLGVPQKSLGLAFLRSIKSFVATFIDKNVVNGSRRKRFILISAAVIAVLALVAVLVPAKQLTSMEIYELQRKLIQQKDSLMRLGRANDYGDHLDEFEKYLKIGSDALSHNDLSTASNALQRADREAKWLNESEARRKEAEEKRRQEEEKRRQEETRQKEKRRQEEARQEEKRRQEEVRRREEERLKNLSSEDIVLDLPGNVKMPLVKVKAGSFTMSAEPKQRNEIPHYVTLKHDFYIGQTEVTQAQWKAVMGDNPSHFKGDDLPVEQVSWYGAMSFCDRLNSMGKALSGWKFTLPTETQWEFAARGGTRSKGYKYSGSNRIDDVAWYGFAGYDKTTQPVATKKANELGLYDMNGNVREWCLDDYGYQTDTSRAVPEFTRSANDESSSERVTRSGSFDEDSCDFRHSESPGQAYLYKGNRTYSLHTSNRRLGFRLVLVSEHLLQIEEARRQDEKIRMEKFVENLSSGDIVLELPDDVKLALVKVKAGSFTMSAKDGENWENEVPHYVTLKRDFYIGLTEVTQAQWKAVMGNNPSKFKGIDLPVEQVSWYDAMQFCDRLNSMGKAPSGWKFTLPTETQWEFAARGGKRSKGYKYSGSNNIDEVAWRNGGNYSSTHRVGTKKANELGLYDMSGNVDEWCLDDYQNDSSSAVPEFTRSSSDKSSTFRVFRGGYHCVQPTWACRSACRSGSEPGDRNNFCHGFRLALVPRKK